MARSLTVGGQRGIRCSTCLARLTAHSENKDAGAAPVGRAAVGLCAVEGLRARPLPSPTSG